MQRMVFSISKKDEEESADIMNFSHGNITDNSPFGGLRRHIKHIRHCSLSKKDKFLNEKSFPSHE